MAIPDFQSFFRPVLQLVADGATSPRECLPGLQKVFGLSDEEMDERIPSGIRSRVFDRADWAIFHMMKAGLIQRVRRGVYAITEDGRSTIQSELKNFNLKHLKTLAPYREWLAKTSSSFGGPKPQILKTQAVVTSDDSTPEDRISSAVAEIEASLADNLLAQLLEGSPVFFEKAVVELLIAMGYGRGREGAGRRLGRSGDGGIDGVINEDALGLDAVYIQAKRYALDKTIGRPAIQQFVGSLTGEGASKRVFVATSSFSADALRYVEKTPQRIVLIDGQRFARLMIAHGAGARVVQTITLSEIDENFFAED